jgi:hypothetical protein
MAPAYVTVMDNFLPHVKWRAIQFEGDLDHVDSSHNTRAEPAGADEDDFLVHRHGESEL